MKRVKSGNGTIEDACGFPLSYLHGTPTTASSTGNRWYTGKEHRKPVVVHHTNGTPSNASTTTIYTPQEVKDKFHWDWHNIASFEPVRNWVEANL